MLSNSIPESSYQPIYKCISSLFECSFDHTYPNTVVVLIFKYFDRKNVTSLLLKLYFLLLAKLNFLKHVDNIFNIFYDF
jgi:hypothetical protein